MKIIHKLLILFLFISLLTWAAGYFAVNSSLKALKEPLAANTELLAANILSEIERNIYSRAEALQVYTSDLTLQEVLLEANQKAAKEKRLEATTKKIDSEWTSASGATITPTMRPILDNRLSDELVEMASFYVEKYGHSIFSNIFVTDSNGRTIAMTSRADKYLHANSPWWQNAVADDLYFGDIAFDQKSETYAISIGVRIEDEEGKLVGVIHAQLAMDAVLAPLEELNDKAALDNGFVTYALYTRDGKLINSNTRFLEPSDYLSAKNLDPALHTTADEHAVVARDHGDDIFSVHTHAKGHKEFRGLGWTLAIEQNASVLFAPMHRLNRGVLIASAAITVLLALFGLYVIRAIANPVRKIHEAADRVTDGELDIRVEVNKADELGQLATNFNRMTDSLQRAIQVRDKEIVERKSSEEKVRHIAYHDSLTGLPNRALFKDRVEQVLLRGRWHKTLAAILFLDLDRFKAINDSLGHHAGDELLVTVAGRLKSCLRDGDTAARIGGDEFTILCQDVARVEDLSIIVDKILSAFRQPISIQDQEIYISTSIGISLYPTDGEDAETLIQNADLAMYRAKSRGRNTCQHFMPSMAEKSLKRLQIENALHNALEQMDFSLQYQPLIDLRNGKIAATEALIRWNDDKLGEVTPSVFIPIAEENGDILPIGRWVLKEACEQNRKWQEMGLPKIPVSVNVSSKIFRESGFVNMIRSVLGDANLEPRYLELEVTESIIMENTDEVLATMGELKELGVLFSIDDFGTGYSSLCYLKKLPLSKLKIDRTFIKELVSTTEDQSIVKTIVTLGHNLDLTVLAEGVETESQLEVLLEVGCDMVQGYLFSKPISAQELSKLLVRKKGFVLKGPGWKKSG
ncbi:MAG: EAL domain-containing protein [Proteobacteria bacterium]|nr:EAL domain-containing protein [Pseudomonadota bacterium]